MKRIIPHDTSHEWWENYNDLYSKSKFFEDIIGAISSLTGGDCSGAAQEYHAVVSDDEAKEIKKHIPKIKRNDDYEIPIIIEDETHFQIEKIYQFNSFTFYSDKSGRFWMVEGPAMPWEYNPPQRPFRVFYVPDDSKMISPSKISKKVKAIIKTIEQQV